MTDPINMEAGEAGAWRMVPVDPTDRMTNAYITAVRDGQPHPKKMRDMSNDEWFSSHQDKCQRRWKAMLAAASPPPVVSVEKVAAIIRDECFEVRDGELHGTTEAATRIIEQFKGKA